MPKAKKPGTAAKLTLADLWDNTDPSESKNQLPVGEHTVRLNSLTQKDDPKKGTAVFAEYEAIDGENEGKKLRQMYKLTDADGGKAQGMAILMRDLEILGHKDIKGKKLKKTLESISEGQPMVIITAKENGQYMNAYLNGLADDIDEDEDEDESEEIEVGDTVTDGDVEGEVLSIKGKKATVKVGKKKVTLALEDLEKVDEDEDEDEDEEEEEEEKPKKGAKKGAKKKASKDDDEEDDEDEDDEDEDEDEDEEDEDEDDEDDDDDEEDDDDDDDESDDDEDEDDDEEDDDEEDEDEDEDEDESDEIEEGDKVEFEDDDGEDRKGTVESIKKGVATVKVGKKSYKVDVDECTKA